MDLEKRASVRSAISIFPWLKSKIDSFTSGHDWVLIGFIASYRGNCCYFLSELPGLIYSARYVKLTCSPIAILPPILQVFHRGVFGRLSEDRLQPIKLSLRLSLDPSYTHIGRYRGAGR